MKITCCMVVRNEAANIREAVASVVGLVDELVICDTGSEDGTLDLVTDLAKFLIDEAALDVTVFEEPWRADFSYHRNQTLARATGDWIFVLDGDEKVVNDWQLREVIKDTPAWHNIVTMPIHGQMAAGESIIFQQRFFRRGQFRYALPVHNQLCPTRGIAPNSISTTAGRIESKYKGVIRDVKRNRTIGMLMDLIDRKDAEVWAEYGVKPLPNFPPLRAHCAYYLAQTYASMSDWEKVILWGEELIESGHAKWVTYALVYVWVYYAYLSGAISYGTKARQGDQAAVPKEVECFQNAVRTLGLGIKQHPHFADLHLANVSLSLFQLQRTTGRQEAGGYSPVSVRGLEGAQKVETIWNLLRIPLVLTWALPGS